MRYAVKQWLLLDCPEHHGEHISDMLHTHRRLTSSECRPAVDQSCSARQLLAAAAAVLTPWQGPLLVSVLSLQSAGSHRDCHREYCHHTSDHWTILSSSWSSQIVTIVNYWLQVTFLLTNIRSRYSVITITDVIKWKDQERNESNVFESQSRNPVIV